MLRVRSTELVQAGLKVA